MKLKWKVDTYTLDGVLICSELFCTKDSARVYMKWFCHGVKHVLVKL